MKKKYYHHIIWTILTLFSCTNPFSTREPEKPSGSLSTEIYEPAIDAYIVIKNLAHSIEQKNLTKYMENFHDVNIDPNHHFRFIPEQYYIEEFTRNWTLMDESDYFNNLIHSSNSGFPHIKFEIADSAITLSPINVTSIDDSLISNNFKYRLIIEFPDHTDEYEATMILRLAKSKISPEYWHIYYWRDYVIEDHYQQTWSYLKLNSGNEPHDH
jgi:hypothetical protein